MFVKIFKRVNIQTVITSFFLVFFASLFINYCISFGAISQELVFRTIWTTFLFIGFAVFIALLEAKKLNTVFVAIHLLSFPLIILLYSNEGGLNTQKIMYGIALLFALNIYTREFKQKQPTKEIFILGVIISTITFFNYNFALFYIVPALFFIEPQYRRLRNVIILLTAILFTTQFLMIGSKFFTGNFLYENISLAQSNFPETLSNRKAEFLWVSVVIISLLIAVFFRPEQYRYIAGKNKVFRSLQFMLVWLIISILFRYLNLYQGNEKWALSFIPTAFFIGLGLDYIKNKLTKELIIIAIIIFAIFFNLYQFNLIPF